jgi:hypothetical protein
MKFVKRVLLFIGVSGMYHVHAQDICQDHCANTTSCISEEHEHGSYCKTWQDPPVCFGLYWTDDSQTTMCFQPAEGSACPETNPVTC